MDCMNKKLYIKDDSIVEIGNIVSGAYAPLTGFLRAKDFESVISDMRISDGSIWPIPIVLDIDCEDYKKVRDQNTIALHDKNDTLVAILKNIEVYKYDREEFCKSVYGTYDRKHPGVWEACEMKEYLVGGDIESAYDFRENKKDFHHTADDCKNIFKKKGWEKIVAFQTRNVPHLGHEFLQMKALEQVDGLLVHPVMGKKKVGDFRDEMIMESYKILINKHFPKDKCFLSGLNLKMRYAGPREALFHALVRKNFGCTHFIVGRDHAGVGDYYEPYAAQDIFNNYSQKELGIEIMKFEEVVFDKTKNKYCFLSECREEDRVVFSGTALRRSIKNKDNDFSHLVRPDIYNYLIKSTYSPFVD